MKGREKKTLLATVIREMNNPILSFILTFMAAFCVCIQFISIFFRHRISLQLIHESSCRSLVYLESKFLIEYPCQSKKKRFTFFELLTRFYFYCGAQWIYSIFEHRNSRLIAKKVVFVDGVCVWQGYRLFKIVFEILWIMQKSGKKSISSNTKSRVAGCYQAQGTWAKWKNQPMPKMNKIKPVSTLSISTN